MWNQIERTKDQPTNQPTDCNNNDEWRRWEKLLVKLYALCLISVELVVTLFFHCHHFIEWCWNGPTIFQCRTQKINCISAYVFDSIFPRATKSSEGVVTFHQFSISKILMLYHFHLCSKQKENVTIAWTFQSNSDSTCSCVCVCFFFLFFFLQLIDWFERVHVSNSKWINIELSLVTNTK